ncbi:hypothetical protein AcW2_000244 [Taiwanofungus camphoratus]|nr:hypothetical protein AcW2_000244 [Antrodia cinnamomea]
MPDPAPPRPSLPTSSSDFALPPSSSAATSFASPAFAADDLSPFMLRFRRPSLLAPQVVPEPQRPSPLAASFTPPLARRRHSASASGEESESDREAKMWTDSPPSGDSGHATPLLPGPPVGAPERDRDASMKPSTSRPRTPPRSSAHSSASTIDMAPEPSSAARAHSRRLSHNVKAPRILTLIHESRPEESELQSEAQFQRLVASCSSQPRTPRGTSDRGRYPEEADGDEPHREDTPSDDGELDDSVPFAYVEPMSVGKPTTPAQSVCGDDLGMLESPGGMPMDVDMPSSSVGSPIVSSWRYTPPPTSCAVRSNKRKRTLDDRYDPYPTASKRRAVSPSVSYLREAQPALFTGRCVSGAAPRLSMPIPIPIPIPGSGPASAASSPIVASTSSYFGASLGRATSSALSSPTMRAQIGLASPVLRPIPRSRRHGGEEGREVEGAGEGVGGLSLG